MEGYIKEIKEQGNVIILTVHIPIPEKPFSPDPAGFSTAKGFEEAGGRYLERCAKYEAETKETTRLHLGLVEVRQEE